MGSGVELIAGQSAVLGAAGVVYTPVTGDSYTIRHAEGESKIQLLNAWVEGLATAVAVLRIRSPLLHDNVEGIRLQSIDADVDPLLPWDKNQPLHTQDTLVLEKPVGVAVQTNVGLLIHYENIPGIDGQFITPSDVKDRIVNIVTVENSVLPELLVAYGAAQALNTNFDLLKSKATYALIGYHVNLICCNVGWVSTHWGNLRIGGPGNPNAKQITSNWFERLSELTGKALIPTFSGCDAARIFVSANGATAQNIILTSILAELSE